jgi:hypothetical protein
MKQQVLVLYLNTSALDSDVLAWAFYDGTGKTNPTTGDSDLPPYDTGTEALRDGWRPYPGHEYQTSFLKHEFWFEKLE